MRFISRPLLRWCLLAIALSLLLSIPAYAATDNIKFEYEQENSTLAPTDKQRGGGGSGPSWGLPSFDFNIWELLGNFFSWAWDALTDFFSSIWDSIKNWYSDLSDPIKGLLKGIGIGILVVVAAVVVVILLVKFGVIAAVSVAALAIGAVLAIAATALYGYLVGGENFNALVAALIGLSFMALPILAELGVLAAIGQFASRLWLSAGVRYQLLMWRVESFISGLIATLRARFLWASIVTHFRLVALQARFSQWLITAGTFLRSQYWRFITAGYLRWTAIQARVGQWLITSGTFLRNLYWRSVTAGFLRWTALQARVGQLLSTFGGWLGRHWTAFMSTRMMQILSSPAVWKTLKAHFIFGATPALFINIMKFIADPSGFNPFEAALDIILSGLAGALAGRFVSILKNGSWLKRLATFAGSGLIGGTTWSTLVYFTTGSFDWIDFTSGALTAMILLPVALVLEKLGSIKFLKRFPILKHDFTASFLQRFGADYIQKPIENSIRSSVNWVQVRYQDSVDWAREQYQKFQKWWHERQVNQINIDQGGGGGGGGSHEIK